MPRASLNGTRLHVIVTKQQEAALRRHAKNTGLTVAEHIRRAVDFYLASAVEKLSRKP